ncbi:MAG: polyketide synthase dehydratase domain-containing protein [Hahellaceae bacterium]|nr:polyketide synthase dehydratase domain-containing protein [Hahellaceae bacterium]
MLDDISRYHLHPALFDAASIGFICTDESDPRAPLGMFLPYAFDRLAYFAPLEQKFWAYARDQTRTFNSGDGIENHRG